MNTEIIAVTNVSGTTWTVTRGAESTTPVAHAAGFTVFQVVTAGWLNAAETVVLPSGDTTGVTDAARINAAVTALGTGSGTIFLGRGNWYLKPGGVSAIRLANAQTVVIDGQWGAVINTVAGTAGDVLRMYNPNSQPQGSPGNIFSLRSGVRGLVIDGTSATAGSAGLHMGDLMNPQVDVVIQNFSGAGDIGLHLDNTVSWTEESDIRAALLNCTSHVVFEVTTGWNSFGYGNYDFTIQAQSGQDGMVLKNGPQLYNTVSWRGRGNFFGSTNPADVNKAVIRASGVCPIGTPNAGTVCKIFNNNIDWLFECGTAGGTYAPATMILDTTNYVVTFGNTGIIDFADEGLAFTQAQTAGTGLNQFQFAGVFSGDPSLSLASGQGLQATSQPGVIFTNALGVFAGQGNLPTTKGDFFDIGTLTAGTTVTMNYFGGNTLGVPQRITIRAKQAAAGGPYTLTWQHNGSPSLSAPTVLWAGGSAPVMSAGANAVDFYFLETFDGITWIGRAIQNVS